MHAEHFEQKNKQKYSLYSNGGFQPNVIAVVRSNTYRPTLPIGPCRSYVTILSWSYHSQNQIYSYQSNHAFKKEGVDMPVDNIFQFALTNKK